MGNVDAFITAIQPVTSAEWCYRYRQRVYIEGFGQDSANHPGTAGCNSSHLLHFFMDNLLPLLIVCVAFRTARIEFKRYELGNQLLCSPLVLLFHGQFPENPTVPT